jgi:prepilin signal peptidase PulO-like enzyme (type II secretory pathway)
MLTFYIVVGALIFGALVALLTDVVIRRVWWWTDRRALPPSTRPAIKRDRKARRLHISRSWVGRRSEDE